MKLAHVMRFLISSSMSPGCSTSAVAGANTPECTGGGRRKGGHGGRCCRRWGRCGVLTGGSRRGDRSIQRCESRLTAIHGGHGLSGESVQESIGAQSDGPRTSHGMAFTGACHPYPHLVIWVDWSAKSCSQTSSSVKRQLSTVKIRTLTSP